MAQLTCTSGSGGRKLTWLPRRTFPKMRSKNVTDAPVHPMNLQVSRYCTGPPNATPSFGKVQRDPRGFRVMFFFFNYGTKRRCTVSRTKTRPSHDSRPLQNLGGGGEEDKSIVKLALGALVDLRAPRQGSEDGTLPSRQILPHQARIRDRLRASIRLHDGDSSRRVLDWRCGSIISLRSAVEGLWFGGLSFRVSGLGVCLISTPLCAGGSIFS